MNQIVVLYDCTFEICFVYERKCGDMMFCNLNDIIYLWKGEVVFLVRFIEVPVVHAYSPFTALLRDDHYVCKPLKILHLFDKTCTQ